MLCYLFQVRDQDVPVKRNYARIVINVSDTNDHAPWFTSSSYEGRVYESAAIGSAVLQVTALDKDKGKNAEIVYSIESGMLTFLHLSSCICLKCYLMILMISICFCRNNH